MVPKTEESTDISRRSRMDRLLTKAVEHPLVILSAGSGYGKTRAVASFVSRHNERVIWFHLTGLANYTSHFWSLWVQAAEACGARLGQKVRESGFPQSVPDVHRFLESVAGEAYRGNRMILVFDDFHCLREGQVRGLIVQLIQACIENLSIILISGDEVNINTGAIPTARMTERQLRFTREEIRIYYTALGIQLTEELLDRVHSLTEGWAFAVNTLGGQLRRDEPLSQQDIDYAATHLFRLLGQQLSRQLSRGAHGAFVLLSQLEEFTLEMAADLTGQQAKALRDAFDSLDLVHYRPETATYYFHKLLVRVLEQERELIPRDRREAFLVRAGRWLEERGLILQAVQLYAKCKAWQDVGRVALEQGAAWMPIRLAEDLLNLMDRFPEELIHANPMLRIIRANLLDCRGRAEEGMRELRELQSRLVQGRDPETDRVLGESYALLAFLNMKRGNLGFVRQMKAAAALLPQGSALMGPDKRLSCGNGNAMIYPGPDPGGFVNMLEAMREAMPYAGQVFGGLGAGLENLAQAELCYYQGDFRQAEVSAYQAAAKGEECRQWDIVCNSHYIIMRVKMATGKLGEVEQAQEHIREYAARSRHPAVQTISEIADSGFYLKIRQPGRMAGWIRDNALPPYRHNRSIAGREVVIRAGYLVSIQEYYEALLFISSCMRACRATGQWFSGLKLQILKAIIYDLLEERDTAADMLRQAWEMAAPGGLIMPFAEYGNEMRSLIRHLRELPGHGIPDHWLDTVHAKASTYAKYLSAVAREYREKYGENASVLETLTRREREVLTLVCRGRKNEEIAKELHLQASTVKGTLNRIYPKLHAINRADAVRIAIGELS